MADQDALEYARQLLSQATPLWKDCGSQCGGACCQSDESGENGMLLFPGEDRYYAGCTWARILQMGEYSRLVCDGSCPRENRPLACRIFPLVILPMQEEKEIVANIVMDVRAWPVCPLMRFGEKGLRTGFVDAVRQAAAVLCKEDKLLQFLYRQAEQIHAYEQLKNAFQ